MKPPIKKKLKRVRKDLEQKVVAEQNYADQNAELVDPTRDLPEYPDDQEISMPDTNEKNKQDLK